MYPPEGPSAVANRVRNIERLSGIHLSGGDRISQNIYRVEYATWSQAADGEVVSAVVIGDESAAEFLCEINSFRFTGVSCRGTAAVIEADLKLKYSPKIAWLRNNWSRKP
jgi:hypothetical protein